MLAEAHYQAVLNFFYFLLFDEGQAISASARTLKTVKEKVKRITNIPVEVILISELVVVLRRYKVKKIRIQIRPPSSDWKIPNREYFGAWKEFCAHQSEEELSIILVLHYVLNFKVEQIAQGLKLPLGTILFRLNRGLEIMSSSKAFADLVKS